MSILSRRLFALACWALVAVVPATAVSQAVEAHAQDEQQSLGKRVHEFADREVERIQIRMEGKEDALQRHPHSVLRWSNLTRHAAYGDTYIWTDGGCARAIVSVYALGVPDRQLSLEFQSLSEQPLIARRGDKVIWNPQTPGVDFVTLEGVSAPAKSPALRLAQMNAIARSFRGEYAAHVTPGEFSELRLLSKPLYRYQSRDPDVIDGAIYGYVESTDPEMLLMIEARADGDSRSWVYSGARSRHDHLRLYRDEQLIWDLEQLAPPWENMRDPQGPYFNIRWEFIAESDELSQLDDLFAPQKPPTE